MVFDRIIGWLLVALCCTAMCESIDIISEIARIDWTKIF